MALIDDDQIEETRRKLPEKLLAILRPGDGLIEAEVDLVGGIDTALLVERGRQLDLRAVFPFDGFRARTQLGHGRAEGPEVIHHRLIDEDIPVSEKQDAFLPASLPQPPDD